MIKKMIINAMVKVAHMSKKAAVVYCINLTAQFLLAVSLLLTGLIFLDATERPVWAIPLIVVGAVFLFTTTVTISIATVSSNYVEKRLKAEEQEEKKEETNTSKEF